MRYYYKKYLLLPILKELVITSNTLLAKKPKTTPEYNRFNKDRCVAVQALLNLIEREFDVAYQTARTDLLNLVDKGYVNMRTMGKKMLFFEADDLQGKLKNKG